MSASVRLLSDVQAHAWSEEEIKALAPRDRRHATDLVVRKYRDRLFAHARGITRDAEEAGDIVQEVFIRAMREPRLFEDEFHIKAWLFRVTSNLCFNRVRDRKRRGDILEGMPKETSTRAEQTDAVFGGERRGEILAAIERLSEDHAEILLLRYYDDLSYAEIADVLEVKLGTVMSRLSRARSRLLEVMGPQAAALGD